MNSITTHYAIDDPSAGPRFTIETFSFYSGFKTVVYTETEARRTEWQNLGCCYETWNEAVEGHTKILDTLLIAADIKRSASD